MLAAGGIGDGRGLAAALCLGAAGAWMGTRFLLSDQADVHPDYQGWLVDASAGDTIFSTIFRGGWPPNTPVRTLPNRSLQMWEEAGRPEPGRGPGEGDVIGQTSRGVAIIRYHDDFPGAHTTGDLGEHGSLRWRKRWRHARSAPCRRHRDLDRGAGKVGAQAARRWRLNRSEAIWGGFQSSLRNRSGPSHDDHTAHHR